MSSVVAAPLGGLTRAQRGAEVIRVDPVDGAADTIRWPLAPSGRQILWVHHRHISEEAIAALSPYRTSGLDQFGRYPLDVMRLPEPLEYDLPIFSTASQ